MKIPYAFNPDKDRIEVNFTSTEYKPSTRDFRKLGPVYVYKGGCGEIGLSEMMKKAGFETERMTLEELHNRPIHIEAAVEHNDSRREASPRPVDADRSAPLHKNDDHHRPANSPISRKILNHSSFQKPSNVEAPQRQHQEPQTSSVASAPKAFRKAEVVEEVCEPVRKAKPVSGGRSPKKSKGTPEKPVYKSRNTDKLEYYRNLGKKHIVEDLSDSSTSESEESEDDFPSPPQPARRRRK